MQSVDHQRDGSFASRAGEVLAQGALCLVTITIAVVPWFLGGAIPHGDLALQLGAIGAVCCALAGMAFCGSSIGRIPLICLPLLGLALVGVLQLLPVYNHPALEMRHAVQFELAERLPAVCNGFSASHARSVVPAETRAWMGRVVSLALIGFVLFETGVSRGRLIFVSSGLVVSGCLMSALSLSQRFGVTQVIVGDHWKISQTTPFGCFVNPNNAAGWLIVCLAAALFLAGAIFRSSSSRSVRLSHGRMGVADRVWSSWMSFTGRIADLTVWQVLSLCSVVLLSAGIASTLSRAGISAAGLGLVALLVSRLLAGRWLAASCCVIVVLLLSCAFLSLLDLDTVVLTELQTLKDPVSESTGRLLHWSDSLASFADFPILGSGLGAYRFATLPYQRHYTGKWFQRADNQYVEVLVESGLLGALCVLSFFLLAIYFIRHVISHRATRFLSDAESARWLASGVVFMGAAMAGAAFFDYGISLPSVAASVVSLVALLERQFFELKADRRSSEERGLDSGGSSFVVPVTWALLLIPAIMLLPDTVASVRVYNAVAPIERLIDRPDFQAMVDFGDAYLSALDAGLKRRPDDLRAQRVRVLFLEMLARRTLLQNFLAGQEKKPNEVQSLYMDLNVVSLASKILDPRISEAVRVDARREVVDSQKIYPWSEDARSMLKQSPFVLSMATFVAANDLLMGQLPESQEAILQSRFTEPHAASALFQLGSLLFIADRVAECRKCWAQSIAASESFRPQILMRVSDKLSPETAMLWFAPESYEASVQCALWMQPSSGLRTVLFGQAADFWKTKRPRITQEIALVRSLHLEAIGAMEETLRFLKDYLAGSPEDVTARKCRAKMLERAGCNGEAYDEWLRIRSFDPGDPEIGKSLRRLIELPPTTGQRFDASPNVIVGGV